MSLTIVLPHNGDAAHIHERHPAQVVGQAEAGVFDLPFPGPAVKLEVHLIEHAQTRGPDGMAEAFQPPIHLGRDPAAVAVIETVQGVPNGLSPFGNVEVFIR